MRSTLAIEAHAARHTDDVFRDVGLWDGELAEELHAVRARDLKPVATNVFYSWQSDLPNPTNHGLIGDALERAVKAIRDDESVQIDPVMDRDTHGIAGAPAIDATIFAKIEAAAAFVCDVSIINSAAGHDVRRTPNPNVLIELGFAAKALGWNRIVMVVNEAYGPVEALPFDVRTRRTVNYRSAESDSERASACKGLASSLQGALRAILTTAAPVLAARLGMLASEVERIGRQAHEINVACYHAPLDDFLKRRYDVSMFERALLDVFSDVSRSPGLVRALDEFRERVKEGDDTLTQIRSGPRPSGSSQAETVRRRVAEEARHIINASSAAARELNRL